MVGKYVDLTESYKSLSEALVHAGARTRTRVNVRYVDSERIENKGLSDLRGSDAVLIPGGFGGRGVGGKIRAAGHAREQCIPYLGICLGLQAAVVEYARGVAGLDGADSTEFNAATPYPVIALVTEWLSNQGRVERRTANADMGGTMRLAARKSISKRQPSPTSVWQGSGG